MPIENADKTGPAYLTILETVASFERLSAAFPVMTAVSSTTQPARIAPLALPAV
jgi:hypothetical protein